MCASSAYNVLHLAWYAGDPGSNPGPTARGWAKKATGIDGLVRVLLIAQSTKENLGAITTTTLMSRTRLAG
jgi:hypothetical protein